MEVVRIGGGEQEIRVTPAHVRVAKALHAAMPVTTCPTDPDEVGASPFPTAWDRAPLHHRLDMLELAHVALLAAGTGGGAPGS